MNTSLGVISCCPRLRQVTSCVADLVHVDVPVSGAREERVAVRAPGEGHTPRDKALRRCLGHELLEDLLVLEIPDLDGRVRRGNEPIVLRAEAERIDGATGIEGVQVLAVVHVPKHRSAVLAARRTQRTIRRDRYSVDNTGMACEVGAQLAIV